MYETDKIASAIHTLLHIKNTDIQHLKDVWEQDIKKKSATIIIILELISHKQIRYLNNAFHVYRSIMYNVCLRCIIVFDPKLDSGFLGEQWGRKRGWIGKDAERKLGWETVTSVLQLFVFWVNVGCCFLRAKNFRNSQKFKEFWEIIIVIILQLLSLLIYHAGICCSACVWLWDHKPGRTKQ